jgi:hypothetical protein
MSTCPENPYNSTQSNISACEGAIDPMSGAVIPEGITAVELFVNSAVEWELDPEQPGTALPTLLLNQASGGLLIDEGVYLAII